MSVNIYKFQRDESAVWHSSLVPGHRDHEDEDDDEDV